MSDKELLTTAELAAKLKVSTDFILRKVHEGVLPYTKLGRPYRFRLDESLVALNNHNKKAKRKKKRKDK